ncbi:DUF1190 family protein [Salinimonas chungwhensis]|uniref:DUF1190 family protein n=1 Tax=Salinimonas chungwhensis TaxID=265425 RepID=UPI00037ACF95|nr:DUF1190 family protein [Salinimonas chungwhensis]
MSTQKRTKQINLSRMRKSVAVKPLAVGVAGMFLSACTDNRQQADIYTSVEDCTSANPDATQECQAAYQQAVEEAARTSPKFSTVSDCEYEFGDNQCRQVSTDNGSFFMPFMAGYMVSQLLSPRSYYSQPLFTSSSRYSPFRSRWVTADGHIFSGDVRKRNYRVNSSTFKPKPTVSRTISRGGFGSSVRAKSAWGSRSRSSGWGG